MNQILKIFKKKSVGVDAMVEKYRSITTERAEIVLQMDSLKLQLLNSPDPTQTKKKLQDMQLDLEMADVALTEIRGQLIQLLEAEAQADFDRLPQERADYEKELDTISAEAGAALGQAVAILQAISEPATAGIVNSITEEVGAIQKRHGKKISIVGLSKGFTEASSAKVETSDFMAWKKKLIAVESKNPSSPETKRGIDKKVDRMLGITVPFVSTAIPGRLVPVGTVDS